MCCANAGKSDMVLEYESDTIANMNAFILGHVDVPVILRRNVKLSATEDGVACVTLLNNGKCISDSSKSDQWVCLQFRPLYALNDSGLLPNVVAVCMSCARKMSIERPKFENVAIPCDSALIAVNCWLSENTMILANSIKSRLGD